MKCPACGGEKVLRALVCRTWEGDPVVIPCSDCQGTGEVAGYWPEEGKRLRTWRVDGEPYRNLRDMAKLCGVDVVDLSRAERGLWDPAEWPERMRGMYGLLSRKVAIYDTEPQRSK